MGVNGYFVHSGLGNSSTCPLLELLNNVTGVSIFGVSINYAQLLTKVWPCNADLWASLSMADLKSLPFPFEWTQLYRFAQASNTRLRPHFTCTNLGKWAHAGSLLDFWVCSSSRAHPVSSTAAGLVQLSHNQSGNPAGGGLYLNQFAFNCKACPKCNYGFKTISQTLMVMCGGLCKVETAYISKYLNY